MITDEELWNLGQEMRAENSQKPVVIHGNDYAYTGLVVCVFKKNRGGHTRCVVEDARGLLMIHGPHQVTRV